MKTFADVKRKLEVGVELKLVRHDTLTANNPKFYIGMVRKIIKKQSNGIQFDGGSWLFYPPASDILINENGFDVLLSAERAQFMSYEFV